MIQGQTRSTRILSQVQGIDYDINGTSSPIVCMETNRLLLALATHYNLEVQMVDVKGTYLNGKLNKEIYMKQLEGFTDGTDQVLKLHKTIYRLEQSGRVWNHRLNKEFKKLGFQQLLSDQASTNAKTTQELSVQVNDMAIYASNGNLIAQIEKELEQAFEISRLGDIKLLLGMEIHQDSGLGRSPNNAHTEELHQKNTAHSRYARLQYRFNPTGPKCQIAKAT
jgi:hypothetical protein